MPCRIFAFGMLVSLFSAAAWVYVATYFCLAVSTTHSISESLLTGFGTTLHAYRSQLVPLSAGTACSGSATSHRSYRIQC